MMKSTRKHEGFTLIDIMIIIVIVGLLMSIAIPLLVKARYYSHLTSCIHNLKTIAKAMENYRNDHRGMYPLHIDNLVDQSYIYRNPKCPSNGCDYSYKVNRNRSTFTITCQGWHYRMIENVPKGFPQYHVPAGVIESPPK